MPDRFVVTSVTGYPSIGGSNNRKATVYQVLDSVYCYELCFETYHRRTADECAGFMNMGDFDWPTRRYHRQAVKRALDAKYRAA